QLMEIEAQLDKHLQASMQTLQIRSATKWLEEGERNNSYFYRQIAARSVATTMNSLRNPATQAIETDTSSMCAIAKEYYSSLYRSETVDQEALKIISGKANPWKKISKPDWETLTKQTTEEELLECLKFCPTNKSPGLDGISFELLTFIL
ncbi:hypothetical protein DM01DRAFT_1272305, partial [Hesseltinella vesiculosa]